MIPLDIPPTAPPPIEYHLIYDEYSDQQDDLLINSSPIGAGKWFIQETESATQPWRKDKRYIILIDDALLSIEPPVEETQLLKQVKDNAGKEAITFVDRLNPIKEQLALSITQLAELLGVTRKTIYDWYDGIEPRSNTMTRIEILTKALQSVSNDVDLKRLKVIWNIPISGQSLREVFNNNLDDGALLEELTTKLHELTPNMVKQTRSPRKPTTQMDKTHLSELDKHADFA